MPLHIERLLSERARSATFSEVRELMKYARIPGMIYLAGGYPCPEAFPTKDIERIACDVIRQNGSASLQYGETIGYEGLRKALIGYMNKNDVPVKSIEEVMVTSGSQQALDLTGRIFINPGDPVIVEDPTYLAELQVLRDYKARIIPCSMEKDGINIDELTTILEEQKVRPKFLYTIPDFQNPSGITMIEEKRKQLISLSKKFDFPIVEDSPYSRLRYEGNHVKPIKYFDTEGRVIYLATFSKLFAPGLRVGPVITHPKIIDKLVQAKQSADLFTESFGQYIAERYITEGCIYKHIPKIIELYRPRRDAMDVAIKKHFGNRANYVKPEGGMFFWLTFAGKVDTKEMLPFAIERKVAYVSSGPFRSGGQNNGMRLNFTNQSPEKIDEGINILAELFDEKLTQKS
jgi:2-aminoadipate transaminase